MIIKNTAYFLLFLSITTLTSLLLIKRRWKMGVALLTGSLCSFVILIIAAVAFNDLPFELVFILFWVLLIIAGIVQFIAMDNTYDQTGEPIIDEMFPHLEKPQKVDLEETKKIDCPYCGLEILVTDKACCHCGHDLTEADAKHAAVSAEVANQADIVLDMDNPGLAADPEPVAVDEADRRAALWVAGTLFIMSVLAGLIYLATR